MQITAAGRVQMTIERVFLRPDNINFLLLPIKPINKNKIVKSLITIFDPTDTRKLTSHYRCINSLKTLIPTNTNQRVKYTNSR